MLRCQQKGKAMNRVEAIVTGLREWCAEASNSGVITERMAREMAACILRQAAFTDCARCVVLEDLLETATSERDKARDEAAKADDEAIEHKAENLRLRAFGSKADYALVRKFQHRAETAEAALASYPKPIHDVAATNRASILATTPARNTSQIGEG